MGVLSVFQAIVDLTYKIEAKKVEIMDSYRELKVPKIGAKKVQMMDSYRQ